MHSFLNGKVIVKTGDITLEDVDVIVNAANSSLLGGGGVDGAIHRAGGNEILAECRKIRENEHKSGLPTGQAVLTTAGNMKAKAVIHTVGPIYKGTEKDKELLYNCYFNSLKLLVKNEYSTIAFPAISTGVYGYPKNEAAQVSSSAIKDYIKEHNEVNEIRLVFYSASDLKVFLENNQF